MPAGLRRLGKRPAAADSGSILISAAARLLPAFREERRGTVLWHYWFQLYVPGDWESCSSGVEPPVGALDGESRQRAVRPARGAAPSALFIGRFSRCTYLGTRCLLPLGVAHWLRRLHPFSLPVAPHGLCVKARFHEVTYALGRRSAEDSTPFSDLWHWCFSLSLNTTCDKAIKKIICISSDEYFLPSGI